MFVEYLPILAEKQNSFKESDQPISADFKFINLLFSEIVGIFNKAAAFVLEEIESIFCHCCCWLRLSRWFHFRTSERRHSFD